MIEEKIISWSTFADKLLSKETPIDLIKYVAINNVSYLKDKCSDFDKNTLPVSLANELTKEEGFNELWVVNYLEDDDLFIWLNTWIGIYDISCSSDKKYLEELKTILLDISIENIGVLYKAFMLEDSDNASKIFDLIPGNVLERIGAKNGTRKN